MREILFRGKNEKTGKWVFGVPLRCSCRTYIVKDVVWNYDTDGNEHLTAVGETQVDPDTVGQFTGLLDKNGSKIFEGDIVAVFYDCKIQFDGVVQYNNGAFVIKGYSMEYLARENMTFVVECSKWDKPEFLNP